ncbi:MAG TPA: transposase, partial [Pyrinomonadaceae bacterium]|nr:transposase [Pyrinomonadaceae bacterium]
MFYISKDNPCYYFTSVANNRLPVFRTDKLKEIACKAIDEARKSSGIFIFAYVIMPDHFHIITDSKLKPSEILRYLNGVTARRVIDYLKENNFTLSLDKLKQSEKKRGYK